MYPGFWAERAPDRLAVVMAGGGETITYGELERRSNRLAHYLRGQGLQRLDHYSIFMENHVRYVECCAAGERAGLYYTCINSYLQPDEVAYLLQNSQSTVLVTSMAKLEIARQAVAATPAITSCLIVDGPGDGGKFVNLDQALASLPDTPITDEFLGTAMLYSSGTTGRPKGIIRPLPDVPPAQSLPLFDFLIDLWRHREGMVYLPPAPFTGAAGRRQPDHPLRRHGGDHGALRSRAVPGLGGTARDHPQPTRADDVLAHVACSKRRVAATTCRLLEVVIHAPPRQCPITSRDG